MADADLRLANEMKNTRVVEQILEQVPTGANDGHLAAKVAEMHNTIREIRQ
jgi:hypothetical protein